MWDLPLFAFCCLAVLAVFRSHWEMSTSMFLGTFHRTSWSFRVPARTSKQTLLEQRGVRGPSSGNAAAPVPSDSQIHLLHPTAGPPNHWGFWKAWPGGFLSVCPFWHRVLSDCWCQVGTTLSFPSNDWCSKLQNQDEQMAQGLVPGSGSSWVENYRELLNSKRVFEDFWTAKAMKHKMKRGLI